MVPGARRGAAGEQYYAAVSGNADTPEALVASLGEVANSGGAFADLARMRVAAAKAQAGDIPAAVSDFDAIAADTGVEKRIRDLAALRAAHLLVDSASVADIKARVEGFTTEDDPLRHFAREAIGLAAYRAGEFAEAATWFDAIIADPATPQDLRGRTQVMQSLLGAKLAATPEGSAQ